MGMIGTRYHSPNSFGWMWRKTWWRYDL